MPVYACMPAHLSLSLLRSLRQFPFLPGRPACPGSPATGLHDPLRKYIEERGGRFHVRWGCREVQYEEAADGTTRVTGLHMTKVSQGTRTAYLTADWIK
jgi:hypothetical protein